jgi:hypothetical protein
MSPNENPEKTDFTTARWLPFAHIHEEVIAMGMQSFRGAGGAGAVSIRPAHVREPASEYDVSLLAQELLSGAEPRAETVFMQASTVAAAVTSAVVATWLMYR